MMAMIWGHLFGVIVPPTGETVWSQSDASPQRSYSDIFVHYWLQPEHFNKPVPGNESQLFVMGHNKSVFGDLFQ